MEDSEFLTLMEQSIPKYAMNCFINAGYDTPSVVAQMKTAGNSNSLDEIESFILQHFSDDNSCFPPTVQGRNDASILKQRKFVFPPGHRIRITDFINSVKSQYSAVFGKKRSCSSACSAARKQKCAKTDETATSKERSQAKYDLEKIADDVRRRINNWLQKQGEAGEKIYQN